MILRGRRTECAALDRLLSALRAGDSGVLVVRGEAGVGKTALLAYAIEAARDLQVERAVGVESEMELAFAGAHQLVAPLLGLLDRLPRPQRDALRIAFGLQDGDPPDRFLVGLAVLSLLAEAAEERPLLCVIDDAQWLDRASAQTLAFAARRLLAESVAIVFATRTPSELLAGVPELEVGGLHNGDARALLGSVLRGPLDARVRDQIVAETRGNPLALLELPRGLSPTELAGGFGLPGVRPLTTRIEESFRRQLAPLPADTQRLLLVAAAEPVGDPTLVWGAAELLGIGVDAAGPATDAGLLEFGARVQFRHPLVRSSIYRAAAPEERRGAHEALAAVTDPGADPDRRAWHRARASSGPDEDVAEELDRSADRASARGGLAAAAAFLEQAAALTVDSRRRVERALAAAQATLLAGSPEGALGLIHTAEAASLDELQQARADRLRAAVGFAVNRGREAPLLLLRAARTLEPLDPALARETYLEAFNAATFAGRLAAGRGVIGIAESVPALPAAPGIVDLLLEGHAKLVMDGYAAAAPTLRRALVPFLTGTMAPTDQIRLLVPVCHASSYLWDDDAYETISATGLQLVREAGALSALPVALNVRVGPMLFGGNLAAAVSLLEEAQAVSEATASHFLPYGSIAIAAWQGREATVAALTPACVGDLTARGEGMGLTVIEWVNAVLFNGLGRYGDALRAAAEATRRPEELGPTKQWALVELVEAAARAGDAERAAQAFDRLAATTQASGTDWALGVEARSRALLSDDSEGDHREAIDRLERTRAVTDLARAHLVYGEWLRRRHRRNDAREHLRIAHQQLTEAGLDAFADRAGRELAATGETMRSRSVSTDDVLTPQEGQIARMARDGLSNPEIGARLFISPRTVEYHLHKVFAKLDVSSRNHLSQVI